MRRRVSTTLGLAQRMGRVAEVQLYVCCTMVTKAASWFHPFERHLHLHHPLLHRSIMQLAGEGDADGRACRLDVPALVRLRVQQAAQLRRMMGLPGPQANVYRWAVS